IKRSGLGIVINHDDFDAMERILESLVEQRKLLPKMYPPDWDYINQFSQSRLAEQLNTNLCEISGCRDNT
ncbi:hypothetical protein JW979_06880, partial [bacterium]|nr:hypothetical protein [candidate division CSSED10-310 bacterium]